MLTVVVVAYTPNVAEVSFFQTQFRVELSLNGIPGVRFAVDGPDVWSLFSSSHENRCDKSLWYADLVFVICTVLAQVVLTLRSGTSFVSPRF